MQNAVLRTAVRMLNRLVCSTYRYVGSGESLPSGLRTAQLQHMHTAIPAKITDDVVEHMQASYDVITCIMMEVL